MLKRFTERIKRIWNMPDEADRRFGNFAEKISELHDRVGEHTIVHADIHSRYIPTQIIVTGHYRSRDFVKVYNIDHDNLPQLIDILKRMEPSARVGRMDIDHSVPFSVVYERDKF